MWPPVAGDAFNIFESFFGGGGGRGGGVSFGMGGGGGDDDDHGMGGGGMGGMGGFGSLFGGMGGGGGMKRARGPRKDPAIQRELPVTLEELYTGCTKKLKITRKVRCVCVSCDDGMAIREVVFLGCWCGPTPPPPPHASPPHTHALVRNNAPYGCGPC